MKKFIIVIAFLLVLGFVSTEAEARKGWGGWTVCTTNCNPAPAPVQEEVKKTSEKEKARIAAEIERLHKEFRDSGAKDLDELFPEFFNGKDGKTYEERNAELCFEDTWYGRKEITCK